MSKWNESDYLAHWPMAIPFPYSIKRSQRPVPNSTAVNWPQSQFAPLYNAPGSASFTPYSYLQNDVPLAQRQPIYSTQNMYPYAQSGVGPGGDTSALPTAFGDYAMAHANSSVKSLNPVQAVRQAKQEAERLIAQRAGATGLRLTSVQIELIRTRAVLRALRKQKRTIKVDRQIRRLSAKYVELLKKRRQEVKRAGSRNAVRPVATRANVSSLIARVNGAHGHAAPTVRIGVIPTNQPIQSGVPSTDMAGPPPSLLTPERSEHSATGLGDGFAYELAPLQASAPYGDLGGDCGCGCGGTGECAKKNSGLLIAGGLAGILALAALPGFIVGPWVVKQFKPEWSYGKRVAASLGTLFVVSSLTNVAGALGGSDDE